MKARGRESTVRVQTWLNTSQPNRHSVGQLPVAMANTWGSFQRRKLEGLFCWALFCFWLTVSESVVSWSHILLACSCTVPPDKNKNLLCSWKLGSQKYDRGRSHFPIPLWGHTSSNVFSSCRPQLPMVPATPKDISLGTKPSGEIQDLSYSNHRSEAKEHLNMESSSTTH